MAQAKKQDFSPEEQALADWGMAMAHPARVAILRRICREGTVACATLFATLPLAQSTLSRHLKVLRDLGFIQARTKGLAVSYVLDTVAWQRAGAEYERILGGGRVDSGWDGFPGGETALAPARASAEPASTDDSTWEVNLL